MQLLQADAKGRDSKDRHYFGLVRSIVIGERRMMSWCDRYDDRSGHRDTKKMAIGLLMAMSMLDRTGTPTSLFTDRFLCTCIDREHGAWVHVSAPPTSLLLMSLLHGQVSCCVWRCAHTGSSAKAPSVLRLTAKQILLPQHSDSSSFARPIHTCKSSRHYHLQHCSSRLVYTTATTTSRAPGRPCNDTGSCSKPPPMVNLLLFF